MGEFFRHFSLSPSLPSTFRLPSSLTSPSTLVTMRFILSATVSALALIAGSVNALPTKQTQTYTPAKNLDRLAKLMPKSALPAPDGLKLKYVVLGIGTQNYTCATGDENAAPSTTGATGKSPFPLLIHFPSDQIQPTSTTSAPTSTTTPSPNGPSPPSRLSRYRSPRSQPGSRRTCSRWVSST